MSLASTSSSPHWGLVVFFLLLCQFLVTLPYGNNNKLINTKSYSTLFKCSTRLTSLTLLYIYLYMKCPLFSGRMGGQAFYGTSLLQSPILFLYVVGLKGVIAPLTSDFHSVCLVFTILITLCIKNHERVNSVTFLTF